MSQQQSLYKSQTSLDPESVHSEELFKVFLSFFETLRNKSSQGIQRSELYLILVQFLDLACLSSSLSFESYYARLVYVRQDSAYQDYPALCKACVRLFISLSKDRHHESACEAEAIEIVLNFIGLWLKASGEKIELDAMPLEKHLTHRDKESKGERVVKALQGIVKSVSEKQLLVVGFSPLAEDEDDEQTLKIEIDHPYQYGAYAMLSQQVKAGDPIHLYKIRKVGPLYVPLFIVLAPQVCLDITSISECFQDYDDSMPMLLLLNKLKPRESNWYLLRGAVANTFLDKLTNAPDSHYRESFKQAFLQNALAFSYTSLPFDFSKIAQEQFEHIRETVEQLREEEALREVAIEAAFLSPLLGLKGRVDLMSRDANTILELKSGKPLGNERPRRSHAIQTTLYHLLADQAFGTEDQGRKCLLFYSTPKQSFLLPASQRDTIEAMGMRNEMVLLLHRGAENIQQGEELWQQLITHLQHTESQNRGFLAHDATRALRALQGHRDALLEAYQKSRFLFLLREEMASYSHNGSKLIPDGTHDEVLTRPTVWRQEQGEAWMQLRLVENQCCDPERPEIALTWNPKQDLHTLPEEGEFLILYPSGVQTTTFTYLRAYVLKADKDGLRLRLLFPQADSELLRLSEEQNYDVCREPAKAIGLSRQYSALLLLGEAPKRRRDLLLGLEAPTSSYEETKQFGTDMERIVEKADAAEDYFLLLGPPGTGKTSHALRQMVQRFRKEGKSMVLTAYTNRAVDEICAMLENLPEAADYIRIGRESACAAPYTKRLLGQRLTDCKTRNEVLNITENCPLYVGTTLSLLNSDLLWLKRSFDLLIVDEAAQLLEPQLLGLLAAKCGNGEEAFRKFILIGDHKQLPAIVQQDRSFLVSEDPLLQSQHLHRLDISLFQRLLENAEKESYTKVFDTLNTQGRMHPLLAKFPSEAFYGSLLQSLQLPHQQSQLLPLAMAKLEHRELERFPSLAKWSQKLMQDRYFFVSTPSDSSSFPQANRAEADCIAEIIEAMLLLAQAAGKRLVTDASSAQGDAVLSVGIITPYNQQKKYLRQRLLQLKQDQKLREALREDTSSFLENIVIDTVERYQGSQRDIILYGTCSNYAYQMRFLTASSFIDRQGALIDRKLNVAATRARQQFILLGNPFILSLSPLYQQLLKPSAISDTKENESTPF